MCTAACLSRTQVLVITDQRLLTGKTLTHLRAVLPGLKELRLHRCNGEIGQLVTTASASGASVMQTVPWASVVVLGS